MSLYYLDDLSLGEIAEEFDVSRQACMITLNGLKRCLKNMKKN